MTKTTWRFARAGAGTDNVEPTEAAWHLLDEALEPYLDDIDRRARLGLITPARRLAQATLDAIDNLDARTHSEALLLGWAPDFLSEVADQLEAMIGELEARIRTVNGR